jgi:hypothetical protein
MNRSRNSLRSLLRPALVALPLFALIGCEPVQPLAVDKPTFSADDTRPNASDASTNQYGVHYITITTTDSSLTTGQQTQASGVPRSVAGTPIPAAPITWSISPANVASISSTGVVTGGSTSGTATVSATADGVTRSMNVTISATATNPNPTGAPVHMISLTTSASTIKIGQVAQVSGVVRDVKGNAITTVPIIWTASPANVATATTTSSTAGAVTGRGVGTATIFAKADTVTRQLTITVVDSAAGGTTPPPIPPGATGGSYGNATAATLPQATVATGYPAVSRQVRVPAGADLQTAINAAQPGDELLLAPGATYVGNFWLPSKGANSGWIVIRTDLPDASIGAPGTRMTPSRAASMRLAKILTPSVSSALITSLGANHWRLTGVELGATSSVSTLNAVIRFGEGSPLQNTIASIANNLILDRSYVHGSSSLQLNRCVMLNSASSAIIDSWLGDCHSNQGDSQAIVGWNGPGPFLIQNNHLEAGHEVVVFGGGSATIQNLSPSDVTLRGNHIMRPASWKNVWQVKNLLETKHVKRILVEGNVFENNWADAQAGFAFVLKSENQNNDNPWTTTSDVTIRYNRIRNTGNVFNLAANPSGMPAVNAARFVITDNIVENVNVSPYNGDGTTLQLLGGVSDVVMMHNTVVSASGGNASAVVFGQLPVVQRLVLHSNVLQHGVYGMKGGSVGEGTPSITRYAPGALITNNAITGGGSASAYPANNYFPSSLNVLGFLSLSAGNYTLSGGSAYLNKGYDNRDIGANIAQVNSMTQNVVVGP